MSYQRAKTRHPFQVHYPPRKTRKKPVSQNRCYNHSCTSRTKPCQSACIALAGVFICAAARWLYKQMTGTKLDPRRAMLVKAAFAPKDSLIDMAEAVIRAFKNEDSK